MTGAYSWARVEAPHGLEMFDLTRGGTPIGTLTIRGNLPNPSLVLGALCDALAGPAAAKPDTTHGQPAAEKPISARQRGAIIAMFAKLGYGTPETRDQRLAVTSRMVDRQITSTSDLTSVEASLVYEQLAAALRKRDRVGAA